MEKELYINEKLNCNDILERTKTNVPFKMFKRRFIKRYFKNNKTKNELILFERKLGINHKHI